MLPYIRDDEFCLDSEMVSSRRFTMADREGANGYASRLAWAENSGHTTSYQYVGLHPPNSSKAVAPDVVLGGGAHLDHVLHLHNSLMSQAFSKYRLGCSQKADDAKGHLPATTRSPRTKRSLSQTKSDVIDELEMPDRSIDENDDTLIRMPIHQVLSIVSRSLLQRSTFCTILIAHRGDSVIPRSHAFVFDSKSS